MAVKRFRRKPAPPQERGLAAAQYTAGGPLGDLLAVARMAGDEAAAVAECVLSDETVLVARWADDRSELHYEAVRNGDWLYYSETYDHLGDDTTQGIEQFYDPVETMLDEDG